MKTGVININEVSSSYQYRFKPNGHLLEGKILFGKLSKNKALDGHFGDRVKDIYRPGIFKRIFIKDINHGLPYITAQAMMTENPLISSKILSKKMTKNIEPMILQQNTILVSCAGAIGNVKLIDKHITNCIGSQDIIRVIANNDYGFIYAYLSSKQVYDYLQAQLYGSVVPRIEPETIQNIPFVILKESTKNTVDKHVKESISYREQATDALKQAIKSVTSFINELFSCTF